MKRYPNYLYNRVDEPQYTDYLYALVDNLFNGDPTRLFPSFTLYDESHKSVLENKIFNHYKYFEIGYETYERFVHEFREKILEIIPLANKFYQVIEEPDLLGLYNDTRQRNYQLDKEGESDSGKTKTDTDISRHFKDTPYSNYPSTTNYDTDVTDTSTSTTNEQIVKSSAKGKDVMAEVIKGLDGTTAIDILDKIKNKLFDVDLWIISQLRELFMEVF